MLSSTADVIFTHSHLCFCAGWSLKGKPRLSKSRPVCLLGQSYQLSYSGERRWLWWFAVALSGAGFECVVCVSPLRRARVFPAGVLLAAVDDLQERLPAAGRLGPRLWRGMGMHATQRTDAVSSGTDPAHHACGYTLKTSTLITHSDTFDPEVMLKKFLKMHF